MHNPLTDIQVDFEINRPIIDIKLPRKEIISIDDRRQTDGQTSRTTTIGIFLRKKIEKTTIKLYFFKNFKTKFDHIYEITKM